MKDTPIIQLVEMNAKHVHTNLALRYFRELFEKHDMGVDLCTLNINQDSSLQLMRIVGQDLDSPRLILFSVYIWNVSQVLTLAQDIKKILPQAYIVFGGPEVSFHGTQWLKAHPYVDFVVSGAGEGFILALAQGIKTEGLWQLLEGLKGSIHQYPELPMEAVPFGYRQDELEAQYILYFEASRGCPYNCSFCMSARSSALNYRPLAQVESALRTFALYPNKVVKFIDRTFNAPEARAMAMLDLFEATDNGTMTIHLEISPTSLTEAFIDRVSRLRKDLVQFEVGIQSTNLKTLEAIHRSMPSFVLERLKKLCALDNCHTHVDLIAGLPEDAIDTFIAAIESVLAIQPDHLQLGMLKMLNGAPLTESAHQYGYAYSQAPPYTFLFNKSLSYLDKQRLACIEEGIERLYNAERWSKSLRDLHDQLDHPAALYEVVGRQILNQALAGRQLSLDQVLGLALEAIESQPLRDRFLVLAVVEGWSQDYYMGPTGRPFYREADGIAHLGLRNLQDQGILVGASIKQMAKHYRGLWIETAHYRRALALGILKPPGGIAIVPDIARVQDQEPLGEPLLIFKLLKTHQHYIVAKDKGAADALVF